MYSKLESNKEIMWQPCTNIFDHSIYHSILVDNSLVIVLVMINHSLYHAMIYLQIISNIKINSISYDFKI